MGWIELLQALPPLRRRTRPNLAAVVGFFTGGIGLAIYFLSFADLLGSILAILAGGFTAQALDPETGFIVAGAVGGLYGYLRSTSSNARIETPAPSPLCPPGLAPPPAWSPRAGSPDPEPAAASPGPESWWRTAEALVQQPAPDDASGFWAAQSLSAPPSPAPPPKPVPPEDEWWSRSPSNERAEP